MTGGSGSAAPFDLPGPAFVLLSICLPAGLLAIHRDLGHQGDMLVFLDWYRTVSGPDPIYAAGTGINYPALGVLVVSLPARIFESIAGREVDFESYRTALKILLTASETGLVLLLAPLADSLRIPRPRILALSIWALPATWAGGSWFGQIDVVGSMMLAASALGAVRAALAAADGRAGTGWLALAAIGLAGAILTKQLTLFSAPGLLLTAMLCPAIHAMKGDWARAGTCAVLLLATPVLLLAPDPFLSLPGGFRSHLAFVLAGGGSAHGNVLSGNGANIWAIVARDAGASSLGTLYAGIQAKHWGIAIFGLSQASLVAWMLRDARPLLRDHGPEMVRRLCASLVLLTGMTNLAMATLLTGVHERYLYHAVPFLLVGLAYRSGQGLSWARRLSVAAWIVCGWTGFFVLSSIHWDSFAGVLAPLRSHTITGILQLSLLVAIGSHLLAERPGQAVSRGGGPWQRSSTPGTNRPDPPRCS